MRCKICGSPCEVEDRYCYKCGSYLKDRINLIPEENTNNNPMNFFGTLFSFFSIFILVLSVFIYIFSNKSGKLYLNDSLYTKNNLEKSMSLYGYYKTSIVYDTTYERQKIFNITAGNELITKHSDEQRAKCQSTSINEIEQRISNNFKITSVNLCELDSKTALKIENVLTLIFNEFPETIGYMSNITLMNPKINDKFMAAYIPIFEFANSNSNINEFPLVTKSILLLNSNYFLNYPLLDNTVRKAADVGYFPKNANGISAVAHELGHYISFVALLKEHNVDSLVIVDKAFLTTALKVSEAVNSGSFSRQIIAQAFQNYLIKFPNSNLNETDFCALISEYAVSSIADETVAEAVHDYFLNGNTASLASIEIINVLKEILGGQQ